MADEAARRGGGWRLALALVLDFLLSLFALLVTIYAGTRAFPSAGPALGIALIAAPILLVTIGVWAGLFYGFTPERTLRRGVVYFLALFLVSAGMVGGIGWAAHTSMRQEREQRRTREAAELRAVLAQADQALAIVLDGHGGSIGLKTGAAGEPGRIARATKAMMQGVTGTRTAAEDTVDSLRIPLLMLPERLAADPGFAKARAALKQARRAFATAGHAADKPLADFRAVLASAGMDEKDKRDALARFDRRAAADKAERDTLASLGRRLVDECEAQLSDLERSRGKYVFAGGRIEFRDRHAMDVYNAHIRAARVLAEEALKLRK